jgi:hypothetical protein
MLTLAAAGPHGNGETAMMTEALPILSSLSGPLLGPVFVLAGVLRRRWHQAWLQDVVSGLDARTRRDIGLPPAPPQFNARMYL